MVRITLKVEGMRCGMCETHVNDAVRKAGGNAVRKVNSSAAKGRTVIVAADGADPALFCRAIESLGYRVTGERSEPYQKKGLFGLFGG